MAQLCLWTTSFSCQFVRMYPYTSRLACLSRHNKESFHCVFVFLRYNQYYNNTSCNILFKLSARFFFKITLSAVESPLHATELSRKKSFFSGPNTKALPPPPLVAGPVKIELFLRLHTSFLI